MNITISSQHIQLHSNVHSYAKESLSNSVTKYFEHAISSHINFVEHNKIIECSISINDGVKNHVIIFAHASSGDIYTSYDLALKKIESQLKKYKSRLKKHHEKIRETSIEEKDLGTKFILDPMSFENIEEEYSDLNRNGSTEEAGDNPLIIEERGVQIASLSVAAAVMRMDLQNLPALMFKNAKTNKINLVYYRRDGNIAWVVSE